MNSLRYWGRKVSTSAEPAQATAAEPGSSPGASTTATEPQEPGGLHELACTNDPCSCREVILI